MWCGPVFYVELELPGHILSSKQEIFGLSRTDPTRFLAVDVCRMMKALLDSSRSVKKFLGWVLTEEWRSFVKKKQLYLVVASTNGI